MRQPSYMYEPRHAANHRTGQLSAASRQVRDERDRELAFRLLGEQHGENALNAVKLLHIFIEADLERFDPDRLLRAAAEDAA